MNKNIKKKRTRLYICVCLCVAPVIYIKCTYMHCASILNIRYVCLYKD